MAKNNKGRSGGDRPTLKTTDSRAYSIRTYIKAAIVRLALWGVLPVAVAEWLIQRGRLRHV